MEDESEEGGVAGRGGEVDSTGGEPGTSILFLSDSTSIFSCSSKSNRTTSGC